MAAYANDEFATWLAANGFDPATLTTGQLTKLQATWRAELRGEEATADADPEPVPAAQPAPQPQPQPQPARLEPSVFNEQMAALEAENQRIESIRAMTLEACKNHVGSPQKVAQLRQLCEAAVLDQKTTVKDFQLALLRAGRFDGPFVFAPSGRGEPTQEVVEAAVCRNVRLPDYERQYDARTLEAADKHFRHGVGLHDLLRICARQNGWRGQSVKGELNNPTFLRMAFGQAGGDGYDLMAGGAVPSTISLPNLLTNLANKSLRAGFDSVDSAWRSISAIRSVSDFKTSTAIALNGTTTFREVAPSGEIKHGTLSELAYTNRAKTYAIMLGITREHMINDDLGALSQSGRIMGRGAATKIADVFWSTFLNNAGFFTAGNANVSTGAGSALAAPGLKTADRTFRMQTDQEGLPLGAMPRILLVPPTLWYTARELMNASALTGTTTANSLLPASNIFQGAYTVVTSPYMENTAYTGNSATAWYLLADPQDIPVVEVVFLNGRDTPTVDTTELDFNMLGVAMRGFIDFGVALQEYRGGVRSAGA